MVGNSVGGESVQRIRDPERSKETITIGFGAPLLLALLCLWSWFLSDPVNRILVDVTSDDELILLDMALFYTFLASGLWSVTCLLIGRGWPRVLPALVSVLTLVFVVALPPPLDARLDQWDFERHRAARESVVRRIEAGELWSGSNSFSRVNLPSEYPRSVAVGPGSAAVTVYRDEDGLRVVFNPPAGSFSFAGRTLLVYSSNGAAPRFPHPSLPYAIGSEHIDGSWYRVVFSRFPAGSR
jgi:hypothetical protein